MRRVVTVRLDEELVERTRHRVHVDLNVYVEGLLLAALARPHTARRADAQLFAQLALRKLDEADPLSALTDVFEHLLRLRDENPGAYALLQERMTRLARRP
jgi:hypothetical protein